MTGFATHADGKWTPATVLKPTDSGGWQQIMGGSTAPAPPFVPDTGPIRNIATDCGVLQSPWTPGSSGKAVATRHLLHANAASITLGWFARSWTGMGVGQNSTPLRAWARPRGAAAWTSLTFAGQPETTLPAMADLTAANVYADPLPGPWRRGDEIEVLTWGSSANSTYAVQGDLTAPYDLGITTGGPTDVTDPAASFVALGRGPRPSVILAPSSQSSSWALIGDSNSVNAHVSHMQQAFRARRLPYIVNGRYGESTKQVAGSSRFDFQLGEQLKYCDSVYSALLTNDVGEGNGAIVAADLIAFWQRCRSAGAVRVVQATSPPKAYIKPDGTVTGFLTGQQFVNEWLRDGAPIVNGAYAAPGTTGAVRATVATHDKRIVPGSPAHPLGGGWISDVAALLETSLGSGLWNVPTYHAGNDINHYYGRGHDEQGALLAAHLALMGY